MPTTDTQLAHASLTSQSGNAAHSLDRDELALGPDTLRGARPAVLKTLGLLVLGLFPWILSCGPALDIELASEDARAWVVLAYLAPFGVLVPALVLRRRLVALFGYPALLGATFFVLSPLDLRPLNTLEGVLTFAFALLLFIAGTARYGPERGPVRPRALGKVTPDGVDPHYRSLARYLWPRAILLVAFFTVPLIGVYGEAGQAGIAENFGDRRTEALIMVHTIHGFISILGAYLFFLSPGVNLTLERMDLRAKMKGMVSPGQGKASRRNVVLYVLAAALLIAAFALLRS